MGHCGSDQKIMLMTRRKLGGRNGDPAKRFDRSEKGCMLSFREIARRSIANSWLGRKRKSRSVLSLEKSRYSSNFWLIVPTSRCYIARGNIGRAREEERGERTHLTYYVAVVRSTSTYQPTAKVRYARRRSPLIVKLKLTKKWKMKNWKWKEEGSKKKKRILSSLLDVASVTM